MRTTVNQLQIRLAQNILNHVRVSGLAAGHHLTEKSLQGLLGTSRPPIRAALSHLAERGLVEQRPNRGFFLAGAALDQQPDPVVAPGEDDRTYLAITGDRLARALPDIVAESELMRRYDIPRDRLRRILMRGAGEGWIERRGGRGWSFLPMMDSVDAYRETYELRHIIEPAGMLCDGYRPDSTVFARLHAQQQFVLDQGYRTLGYAELFDINRQFHEAIAALSGNRFLLQTLVRQNQLRRLIEYRQVLDRNRLRRQCREHLGILGQLELGDRVRAAAMMSDHLRKAQKKKADPIAFAALLQRSTGPSQ